jgi:SAM-dependent methyltransferase
MKEDNLQELFGNIDIYLFDQLLKGRFFSGMRVLDAGCGTGRNLVYFLRNGYQVFGVDQSAEVDLSGPSARLDARAASAGGEFSRRTSGGNVVRS